MPSRKKAVTLTKHQIQLMRDGSRGTVTGYMLQQKTMLKLLLEGFMSLCGREDSISFAQRKGFVSQDAHMVTTYLGLEYLHEAAQRDTRQKKGR